MLNGDPIISYLIAWLGSFYILFVTITGQIKPVPSDMDFGDQLMRPLFLNQIIFAGYMCCTSIFYFLDVLGYVNFITPSQSYIADLNQLQLVAQCQRYYCLGHAAFVTGILLFMKYPIKHVYSIEKRDIANLLLTIALVSLPTSLLFRALPGLSQFYIQLSSLSFIAGTLALAFAIPMKKPGNTLICSILYISNVSAALLSGFKEPIIISVLVLGVFLYPTYKKVVLVIFVPAIFVLFMLLPTYNRIFREKAWSGETSTEDASEIAFDAVTAKAFSDDEDTSDWGFLTGRLSEIGMFTQFVASTPEKIDYYGFQIVEQAISVIIPRVFWPEKPSTEQMIMERVYNAGVINRQSIVSAKPPFIVDGYLSGGNIGVFLSLLIYGAAAQLISLKAEKLFGGYLLGAALIYSGLFQVLWRGISFEFVTNSVFWSFITMLIISRAFRSIGILKPI
ncbi:MAG: hypothetical protein JWN56_1438 [Sphingobacteriales bacterium]|nr:hypothetical protein [Sphingobacteriales bacterium]